MNKKKLFMIMFIVISISFIFAGSIAYYNATINGNINVSTGNAVFNINGFTNESTKEIILKEGPLAPGDFGSFNLHFDTTGSNVDMYVTLSIDRGTLPTNLKFYTTSDYKSEIHKYYEYMDTSNQSKDITIYWYWNPFINDDEDNKFINSNNLTAILNVNAVQISEYAMMNVFGGPMFAPFIRTITFDNDLSNLPSSCTGESDLCWDVSYDSNQSKKVYAYLIDSGLDWTRGDGTIFDLYNLHIVSDAPIFAPSNCTSMFFGFYNLTSIEFNNNFNTSKVTNMSAMFKGCSSLESLDLSSFNTSNVTDMYEMFDGCSSLTSLDVSNFNTSNVTNMKYMFDYCSSLKSLDLSNFNTSNVTDMHAMFNGCSLLESLNLSSFNTSNVTDMRSMFAGCSLLESLDVSNFNTSDVTNMEYMFDDCSLLTCLDLSDFNTINVTSMTGMFRNCSSLTSLDLSSFNTASVTNMHAMFNGCSSLNTTINIMGTGVTSYNNMFYNAATKSGAKITVNYIADASNLVNNMIATKSSNSNVVKGIQL